MLHVEAGDEVPDRLPFRGAALVGSESSPKWVAFDCPCKSGHRLMVNLDSSRRPRWSIVQSKPLTLKPSIDSMDRGRRCHYWLRDGKVRWVRWRDGISIK